MQIRRERRRYQRTTRKLLNAVPTMQFSRSESSSYTSPYKTSVETRPHLSITSSKKSIKHIDTAPWISYGASGGRHEAELSIGWGRLWKATWKAIFPMPLDYILLGFTKAYASDGAYFGVRLARKVRSRKIEHGLSGDFHVRRLRRLWNLKRYRLLTEE